MTVHDPPGESVAEGEAILRTSNLTKQFGGLVAVDDVNFELERGQIRCLIGPNGAGKSTFVKLISGTHKPSRGKILYDGSPIHDLEPHERVRQGISLKFQKVRIYQNLSVDQNIRIPAQYHYDGDLEQRIGEILEMVGLERKREVQSGNLSHGEQQWLEIAMAMAVDPTVLLLDEPTAGMTIDETLETGELIQNFAERGVSILVVEHDVNLVREVADKVTVMHNGQIFTEGTIEEVTNHEGVQRIYLGKSSEGDQ